MGYHGVLSMWFGTMCVALILTCALASSTPAPAWAPDVAAAQAYAARRPGAVSFSVRTATREWGVREDRSAPSASVVKALLLVTYLNDPRVRGRGLGRPERLRLAAMIRRSDDIAATRVRDFVGTWRLARTARRAGMRHFRTDPIWGLSRVTSQRWGIARVVPRGWRIYFKGGWGSGSGAVDHQVALLRRGSERVAIAILTTADGSHVAGKETLRGVAARLLRGL